jgi:ABC-type iron transport system FetAB ATPase subunit
MKRRAHFAPAFFCPLKGDNERTLSLRLLNFFMQNPPTLFSVENLRTMHVGPLDFDLRASESLVLSGPSGSGKSLLLRAMADLDRHQGTVCLKGKEQSEYRATDWRSEVAYLPADSAWWADTVGEHFRNTDSVNWHSLGFTDEVQSWTVSRLSSGERQRLALLRMLENSPRVLLLDEPTANLDRENTLLVENMITRYVQDHEAAAVWVSHDAEQQERLGVPVIILGDDPKEGLKDGQ